MYDNATLEDGFWVLRHKISGCFAEEYNFAIGNAPNSNDNMMLIVFCDHSRHDAEISAERHFSTWEKDWDLVRVKFCITEEPKDFSEVDIL